MHKRGALMYYERSIEATIMPTEARISFISLGAKLATGITVSFVVFAGSSPFSKAIASLRP